MKLAIRDITKNNSKTIKDTVTINRATSNKMLGDGRLNLTIARWLVPSFAELSWSMLSAAVREGAGSAANVCATAHTSKFIDRATRLALLPPVLQGALRNRSARPQD